MWQHYKMCTNNICWFQVCSVVRMLLCLRDFCPFYLSFSFVMLAPVAATHTGMPLLPTSVNGTGGEFKSKHIYMCCLACWLPEQLLLHCNRSSPAQVGSCTSSLFFSQSWHLWSSPDIQGSSVTSGWFLRITTKTKSSFNHLSLLSCINHQDK